MSPPPPELQCDAMSSTTANNSAHNHHLNNVETQPVVTKRNSFEQLIDQLETAFKRSTSSVDVDELWKVLEDYKSTPSEWAKFAFYDMSKYKRNLVAEFDKFNVMIIGWGPNSQSCIHDHSGSHCFMKVLDGELIESRFAWPDENSIKGVEEQEMCRLSDTRMVENDVLYINGEYILA